MEDLNPYLGIGADNLAINPNYSQFFKLHKPVEYDKKINILAGEGELLIRLRRTILRPH